MRLFYLLTFLILTFMCESFCIADDNVEIQISKPALSSLQNNVVNIEENGNLHRDEIEWIKNKLDILQNEFYEYRSKKTPKNSKIPKDSSMFFNVRIDEIDEDIRELNGQIEKSIHSSSENSKKMVKFIEDSEFRMSEHENSLAKINDNYKKLNQSISILNSKIKKIENHAKKLKNNKIKSEYDNAFALFKAGKYNESQSKFAKFIKQHPKHQLSANSMFWTAEILVKRNYHTKAIGQYITLYKQFPNSNKANESLFKMAQSLAAIKKFNKSCQTLKKLSKKKNDKIMKEKILKAKEKFCKTKKVALQKSEQKNKITQTTKKKIGNPSKVIKTKDPKETVK